MKIIKVRFYGGIGNQLFQYATARALLKKNDVLLLDCTGYGQDYLDRGFALDNFKIKGLKITNKYILKLFKKNTKLNRIVAAAGLFKNVTEQSFYFHTNLNAEINYLTSIEGYWQTEEYFKSIKNTLVNEVIPLTIPAFPSFMQHPQTVAVHVRRTDYLTNPLYGFLGEAYYQHAIAYFRSIVHNPFFVFFSDDMAWCRKNFKDIECVFFDEKDWEQDYLQLYLISKCKHQIIANSSFSWWGAWINTNENKKVIRPANPFNNKQLLYENYYPQEWIAI